MFILLCRVVIRSSHTCDVNVYVRPHNAKKQTEKNPHVVDCNFLALVVWAL